MNVGALLKHYERIADAPDAVARLRRFVLDLAVRGKLVRQEPDDEPASKLLHRIFRITNRSATTDIGEFPFLIPDIWAWSAVGLVTTKTGSGSTPRGGKEIYKTKGVAFLRSQNIYNDGLRLNDVAYIEEATHKRMSGTAVAPGDLLLNITGGSIGRCCLLPNDQIKANISQHVAIVRPAIPDMGSYLHVVILSPYFQAFVLSEQTGAGRGGLPKNRMDQIYIPVPPLAEQHRIVAKIDELMTLCDQLEASLSHSESIRARLLEALLHGALQPGHNNVIDFEAARQKVLAKREAVGCQIIQHSASKQRFGRIGAVKALYLAEAHCGIDLGGEWGRADFGPYDHWILSFESHAATAGWFSTIVHTLSGGGTKIEYVPGPGLASKAREAAQSLDDQAAEFERVLDLLSARSSEESEIFATLFAAWNDLLLEHKPISDDLVIAEFREHWGYTRKAGFTPAQLRVWLDWMRESKLVPQGRGPNTRLQGRLI